MGSPKGGGGMKYFAAKENWILCRIYTPVDTFQRFGSQYILKIILGVTAALQQNTVIL